MATVGFTYTGGHEDLHAHRRHGGTALFAETRVSKDDPRVAAYGDVDELKRLPRCGRAQSELAGDMAGRSSSCRRTCSRWRAPRRSAETIAARVSKAAVPDAVYSASKMDRSIRGRAASLRRFILPAVPRRRLVALLQNRVASRGASDCGARHDMARRTCLRTSIGCPICCSSGARGQSSGGPRGSRSGSVSNVLQVRSHGVEHLRASS